MSGPKFRAKRNLEHHIDKVHQSKKMKDFSFMFESNYFIEFLKKMNAMNDIAKSMQVTELTSRVFVGINK